MSNEYVNYSNTQWARTLHTTIVEHIAEVEDAAMRNFPIYAMLDSSGRIKYNQSGAGMDWPVKYRHHDVQGNTGETPRNFKRKNLWQTAKLEYRGYQATDAISYKETRENRGAQAIIKLFEDMAGRLETSLKHHLSQQWLINGDASGNEEFWHGIETMFQHAGTVNATTGAQQAKNAADIVAYPDGTYAGLSTELGNFGGANSDGDVWPNGVADSEYDFWSPIIVNVTTSHADLPNATNTWAGQGDEAMRYAIIHSQRNASQDGQIDMVALARNWYMAFLNLIDEKEQIQVGGGAQTPLRALGFKNVVMFDGIEVTYDTAIGNSTGYGMSIENMELRSMDETLLRAEGPEYDIDTQDFKFVVSTLSNLKFKSPRNFFKLMELANMTDV